MLKISRLFNLADLLIAFDYRSTSNALLSVQIIVRRDVRLVVGHAVQGWIVNWIIGYVGNHRRALTLIFRDEI